MLHRVAATTWLDQGAFTRGVAHAIGVPGPDGLARGDQAPKRRQYLPARASDPRTEFVRGHGSWPSVDQHVEHQIVERDASRSPRTRQPYPRKLDAGIVHQFVNGQVAEHVCVAIIGVHTIEQVCERPFGVFTDRDDQSQAFGLVEDCRRLHSLKPPETTEGHATSG
jgi:hypothetical protein